MSVLSVSPEHLVRFVVFKHSPVLRQKRHVHLKDLSFLGFKLEIGSFVIVKIEG